MGKDRRASRSGARAYAEARAGREAVRRRRAERRRRRRRDRRATELASWQGHGSCGRKARFPTRQGAESFAAGVKARFGTDAPEQSAYECPLCGGWHLTSHPWWSIRTRTHGEGS